ncbi:hypothetical protein J4573_09255 [Actinomadura barringtoniae]|uniref:Uncharacterized protein n=1 Tax=Actinomadura barringtoniae TaxID=1427535 RepID=A0A939P7Y5_9ACTN|nr:hypothetical protein [Actinomadura barringtoniae]MBO2447270.1 hypothetical protein [Actinomadura barringtoniae]
MSEPDDDSGLRKLLMGPLSPQPVAPTAAGRGGRSAEYRAEEIKKVAAEMSKDLAGLRNTLNQLKGTSNAFGQWDVAQSLSTKMTTAHGNLVQVLQAYCDAYDIVIRRVERTARNYSHGDARAKAASERAGSQVPTPPSNLGPW